MNKRAQKQIYLCFAGISPGVAARRAARGGASRSGGPQACPAGSGRPVKNGALQFRLLYPVTNILQRAGSCPPCDARGLPPQRSVVRAPQASARKSAIFWCPAPAFYKICFFVARLALRATAPAGQRDAGPPPDRRLPRRGGICFSGKNPLLRPLNRGRTRCR